MRDEIHYSIKKFSEAADRLAEGIDLVKDELDKDGVIQRFEFTFELMWKTLKLILTDEGIICHSPKECLQSAFRFGILTEEEAYLNMLSDRNVSSHIYNSIESEEIYIRIKDIYQPIIKNLSTLLLKNFLT